MEGEFSLSWGWRITRYDMFHTPSSFSVLMCSFLYRISVDQSSLSSLTCFTSLTHRFFRLALLGSFLLLLRLMCVSFILSLGHLLGSLFIIRFER